MLLISVLEMGIEISHSEGGVPDPIVDDFIGYPILSQERNTTVTKRVKTAVLHPEGIQDEMKFPADVILRKWRAISSLEHAARRASAKMLAKISANMASTWTTRYPFFVFTDTSFC